jgi:hypothetical protein
MDIFSKELGIWLIIVKTLEFGGVGGDGLFEPSQIPRPPLGMQLDEYAFSSSRI